MNAAYDDASTLLATINEQCITPEQWVSQYAHLFAAAATVTATVTDATVTASAATAAASPRADDVVSHTAIDVTLTAEPLTVLVMNANASVGLSTVQHLSAHAPAGCTIRAAVKDPQRGGRLTGLPAVSVVSMDAAHPDSVTAALTGVARLFLVPPVSQDRVQTTVAVARAAVAAGVRFAVLLSHVAAADGTTVLGREYAQLEQAVRATGLPTLILRASLLLESYFAFADSVRAAGAAGASASRYTHRGRGTLRCRIGRGQRPAYLVTRRARRHHHHTGRCGCRDHAGACGAAVKDP